MEAQTYITCHIIRSKQIKCPEKEIITLTDEDRSCLPLKKSTGSEISGTICCCSIAQLCPTLCDPSDCSLASRSFTISWSLLKLTFIESLMSSNHLIFCHPLLSSCLQSFPASGSFLMSQKRLTDFKCPGCPYMRTPGSLLCKCSVCSRQAYSLLFLLSFPCTDFSLIMLVGLVFSC